MGQAINRESSVQVGIEPKTTRHISTRCNGLGGSERILVRLHHYPDLPVRSKRGSPFERPEGLYSFSAANMSLSNLSNVISHLKNASKARLGLTSIPLTKLHFKLSIALRDAGFVSAVVPGGPKPPQTDNILSLPQITMQQLERQRLTQANMASARLWLGLKYWQSEPVMRNLQMISTPKRKITLSIPELRRIVRGEQAGQVKGLRSPGECIFLSTDLGLLESRECVEKHVGGLALCRVE